MPIYEYECRDCGKHHEAKQSMSEDALVDCPVCGKAGLERLISPSSFALKGDGWYHDGYGGNSSGAKDSTKKASTASTPPKTEPATQAEPAAKAQPKSSAKPASGGD